MALSADNIELFEIICEDDLLRISFRACERLRRGNANLIFSIHGNGAKVPFLIVQTIIATITSIFSILVIGLMSDFNHGSSLKTERIILIMWLVLSVIVAPLVPFLNINDAFTFLVRIAQESQSAATTHALYVASIVVPNTPYTTALVIPLVCLPNADMGLYHRWTTTCRLEYFRKHLQLRPAVFIRKERLTNLIIDADLRRYIRSIRSRFTRRYHASRFDSP